MTANTLTRIITTLGGYATRVYAYTDAGYFTYTIAHNGQPLAEIEREVNRLRSFAYRTPSAPRLLDPRDSDSYYEGQRARFEANGWEGNY